MNYYEVKFTLSPYDQQKSEILVALLAEIGFDSFQESDEGVNAYIPEKSFCADDLANLIKNGLFKETQILYHPTLIENQNWNKRWESNFDPINIENFCRIRAPFHKPEKDFTLDIVIEPKMSFGTGHHQTTWLMVRQIFNLDVKGKRVLDMGCGTGILAIVAEKLGAENVVAIDNDQWAFENATENAERNHCNKIRVFLGDASLLNSMNFDIILANINLNTLISDLPIYKNYLSGKGKLIISGILRSDIPVINKAALELNLFPFVEENRNDWVLIGYECII
jgi:ribosomal protein L11 methyltransferase